MTSGGPSDPNFPLFLITSALDPRELLGAAASAFEIRTFTSVRHFLDDEVSEASGCVLLPSEVGAQEVRVLLARLAARAGPWMPVLVGWSDPDSAESAAIAPAGGDGGESGRQLLATPLSLGYPEPLDPFLERLEGEDGETVEQPPVLELRTLLAKVSRTRHDINNPLTAALAETQLLLMDLEEGDAREAILIVEHQLRRIRDMVAELSFARAPRNPS